MRGHFFELMKKNFSLIIAAVLLTAFFVMPESVNAAFTFTQSGADDFGDSDNSGVEVMETFNGHVYACTVNANGVQIWRTSDPANLSGVAASAVWTKVANNGFGDSLNGSCGDMLVFNNQLYVSTRKEVNPGELWRTSNGTSWSQVGADGFGDANNYGIGELESFGGRIYANTVNTNQGSEVWRSDTNGENFALVAITDNGFGDANNTTPRSGIVFGGNLFFAGYNLTSGAEVWRSSNGTSWSQVNADGFGTANNADVLDMVEFNSELYLSTSNGVTGGELWKTATGANPASFTQVAGITEAGSVSISALHVRNNLLFLMAQNFAVGTKVWSTPNGTAFTQQNISGFGDSNYYNAGQIGTVSDVTVFPTSTAGGDMKLFYADLSPTISNVSATQRNDGTGYVDITFDVDTPDGSDVSEAYVEFDVGNGFKKAYILEGDTDTTATLGDPKVDNVNANQIGNSLGYIETSGGSNSVSIVWHSKRDNANVIQNNSVIRIRGFSGTNGSFDSSATFAVSNSDLIAPSTSVSPPGGVYASSQTITLSCSDGLGAGCDKTYYTVDGSTPTTASNVYSGPIAATQSFALKYFSVDFAGNQEAVQTDLYTITSTGPALRLAKSVLTTSGGGSGTSVEPDDFITYFVDYQNLGLNSAHGVLVFDTIPSNSVYRSGTLVLNGAVLTDAQDGDAGDVGGSTPGVVTIDLGSIPAGASGRFSFQVQVNSNARHAAVLSNEARAQYNPWNLSVLSNQVQNTVVASGGISGIVFNDANQNGVRNASEVGIAGATVRVFEDVNKNKIIDAGDVGVFIGGTNQNGEFSISNLSAAFYVVQVDQSSLNSRFTLTTGNNPGQVVLRTSTQKFNSAYFGFYRRSSIIGRVIRTIVGGPSTATNANLNANVNGNTNSSLNSNINLNLGLNVNGTPDVNQNTPENINSISGNTNEQAITSVQEPGFFEQIWNNNALGQVIDFGVAPLAAVAAIANILSAVSVANTLLPYLSSLFTEPFRFFGARKVKRWGKVYNSLTKEPIDLAIVRLFDKETKKLQESFVTDSAGRYYFLAEPEREYYLTVTRDGFMFPSRIDLDLKNKEEQYSGGSFSFAAGKEDEASGISKGGVVSFEIPLDPEQGVTYLDDQFRKPIKTAIADYGQYISLSSEARGRENKKLLRAMRAQRLSQVFAFVGPILGLVSFILAPSVWTGALLVVHGLLFFVFNRLAAKRTASPWGSVFDSGSGNALPKAIVRLFEPKFGRLLHTRVTTGNGRYGFLVGDKDYIIVPEKEQYFYPDKKIQVIPKNGIVKEDIGLDKQK